MIFGITYHDISHIMTIFNVNNDVGKEPKFHRGGLKANQTPPEGLEFEGHVAPSNSSTKHASANSVK